MQGVNCQLNSALIKTTLASYKVPHNSELGYEF